MPVSDKTTRTPAPAPTPPDAVREALADVIRRCANRGLEHAGAVAELCDALGIEYRHSMSEDIADALLSRAPVGGTWSAGEVVARAKKYGIHSETLRRIEHDIRAAPVPPAQEGERSHDTFLRERDEILEAWDVEVGNYGFPRSRDIVAQRRDLFADRLIAFSRAAPSGVTEAMVEAGAWALVHADERDDAKRWDEEDAERHLPAYRKAARACLTAALEARRVG